MNWPFRNWTTRPPTAAESARTLGEVGRIADRARIADRTAKLRADIARGITAPLRPREQVIAGAKRREVQA